MKFVLALLVAATFIACDTTVTLGYDEAQNPTIVSSNLNLSPKENVRQFLSRNGVEAQSVGIYSSPKKDCACAKAGDDCYCKLQNPGAYQTMCSDGATLCSDKKFVEVVVYETDADVLTPLGFEMVQ